MILGLADAKLVKKRGSCTQETCALSAITNAVGLKRPLSVSTKTSDLITLKGFAENAT